MLLSELPQLLETPFLQELTVSWDWPSPVWRLREHSPFLLRLWITEMSSPGSLFSGWRINTQPLTTVPREWSITEVARSSSLEYLNDLDVDYLHCLVDQRHIYPLSGNKQFQFTIPAVTVGNYQYKSRAQTIIDSTSRYIAAPGAFVANVLYMLGLPSNTLLPAMVPCDLKIEIDFQFPLGTGNSIQSAQS